MNVAPLLPARGAAIADGKANTVMAMGDKIKHAAEEAAGKVKEGAGKVTGNEELEARGQSDQASANVKQAGDKAVDAATDAFGK